MDSAQGSRTAVLVCQGRAAAHGRLATGRFADPTAARLLRGPELLTVEQVRAGTVPAAAAERMAYESVLAGAEVMVPRTVAIDEAIRGADNPQLVLLGAGLDGRAWRLTSADTDVFEVDHPASQADKRSRLDGLAPTVRSVRFVPLDFGRDRLVDALAEAGHHAGLPTTWIWEGVVPYLTRAEVATTLDALTGLTAPGSRLVVSYQARAVSATAGRIAARAMIRLSGQRSPWADEPVRSTWTPAAMRQLLANRGFRLGQDDDLLHLARTMLMPVSRLRSLANGRVAVADR